MGKDVIFWQNRSLPHSQTTTHAILSYTKDRFGLVCRDEPSYTSLRVIALDISKFKPLLTSSLRSALAQLHQNDFPHPLIALAQSYPLCHLLLLSA